MANALTSVHYDAGTEGILLHQSLHGYAEGHRLIESSIPIPNDLQRVMLRMSDLSGTGVVNGFQEYLTGYPLTSLNAYALAKTWYAPEMPRPGCVWTHTFIIPASFLAQIPSLAAIRPLFRRPSERSVSDFYSRPIFFDSARRVFDAQSNSNQIALMQSFLLSHYQQDWHPLILSANDSNEFADMIFAVWSQKWPALRMSFTFCTGSLSARTFDKRPLDVQCAPTTATRQVFREVAAEGVGEPIVIDFTPPDLPTWTILAANDALRYEGGPLRDFLWSASDIDSARSDFPSFVKIYDGLAQSLPYSDILEQTADFFPRSTDGRHLKLALFGSQPKLLVKSGESKDILLALAMTERYESFDADELSIAQQASHLIAEQPTTGCQMVGELLRASLNPLGEQLLTNLILDMKPEDALVIATNQPQFLPTLFRVNPRLGVSAQLWMTAGDRRRELFESVVSAQNVEPELARGIVNALLDSNSQDFIRRAFSQWGRVAVFQALDWSEAHGGLMPECCRAALTAYLPDVMSWVGTAPEKSTDTLAAVAHVVAPYSSQVAQNDSTIWLQTFRALQEGCRTDEANYVCTFLLSLALCNAPPAPLDLVSESFERVHQLAEREQLREDAWFILQPLVPELSWGKNWDRCERIRRALMSAFMHHSWPAWELSKRIKNQDMVRQLLRSARRVGAESYFQNV